MPHGSPYLVVYPFVKVRPWYALPEEDRQRAMDEHIRIGREEFPAINNHTTYSFGIDDQEFMTAFECDEPADFMHLMLRLRDSEASRYTERDTPIFVGQHVTIREALDRARRRRCRSSSVAAASEYVCWSRQVRHIANPQPREHAEEREDLQAVRPAVPVDADIGDCKQRCRRRRPTRARVDQVAISSPPFPPHEVDEEGDREDERDPREDHQRDQRASS